MGAAASVLPDEEQEKNVHETLLCKFEAIKLKDEGGKLPESIPDTLKDCVEYLPPDDADKTVLNAYKQLQQVFEERMEEFVVPEISSHLKMLPDALDQVVYQHERWPVLLDPTGQGGRFMKYQRGTFLSKGNPLDTHEDNLRRSLVGALQHGTYLILDFDELENMDIESLFSEDTFPKQVLNKVELFHEAVWGKLLRSDQGDPSPDLFSLKDEFKFVVITKNEAVGREFAARHRLALISVLDANESKGKRGTGSRDCVGDEIAAAFGARDIKRNSPKLVEAAFDGEWDVIQEYIDKGYSHESEDPHQHTAISEAACQGHNDIVQKLLDMDANPNAQNDAGRTPLYRASYNGHLETCRLLLENGADPRLCSNLESPIDVAKTDEVRELIEAWDVEETDRIIAKKKEDEEKRLEERLSTAAERDAYAREKIRQELVALTLAGEVEPLKDRLQELADEALQHNERPRGFAECRDDRGNTLLLIAIWKNHIEVVEMLLSHFETFDPEMDKVERKTFFANIKARDSKGWNGCALATFHEHKKILQLLLDKGCDPYVKNSYNKNSFDLAQDEKDACRAVVTDRSEIRGVLLEWEQLQNPRVAHQRKQEELDAAKKAEEEAATAADPKTKSGANKKGAKEKQNSKKKKKGKKK